MAPALLRARINAPDVDGDPGPIRTGDLPLRRGAIRSYAAKADECAVTKVCQIEDRSLKASPSPNRQKPELSTYIQLLMAHHHSVALDHF
jgi:hypothetical protein